MSRKQMLLPCNRDEWSRESFFPHLKVCSWFMWQFSSPVSSVLCPRLVFSSGVFHKVSIQGVVALGSHFATLCWEVDFYEAIFFFIINFQKEKANTFTLLIILIVKSLQIELNSTHLLLWPPNCRNKRAITPKCYNS